MTPSPRTSRSSDSPLTAERAIMEQIRTKLERAQRSLSHTSSSSGYISSSRYSSTHEPPIKSVLVENIPSVSKGYALSSRSPYDVNSKPSKSKRYPHQQYKSRSKYTQELEEADPLNGGPPPLSTPFLVYSSSRPPLTRERALRSRTSGPPTSRVRFEGESNDETERKRRDRELMEQARDQRRREEKKLAVRDTKSVVRDRRSSSIEKPPKSAIKLSAYDDIAHAIPTSPARPPQSDIQVEAFNEVMPRRSSGTQVKRTSKLENDAKVTEKAIKTQDNQEIVKKESMKHIRSNTYQSQVEIRKEDVKESSIYDSDSSFDGFDTDSECLSSECSAFDQYEVEIDVDKYVENTMEEENNLEVQEHTEDPSNISTIEEDKEKSAPTSRLTAKDLAFHALGRTSSSSISDLVSPISSMTGKEASKTIPTSYTPMSCAFPPSRRISSQRDHQKPSSSVSSYVRRSRARAPMDLKNHLPPSIGVLSGLSSGSSTFVLDSSYFYQITWRSGEFAFSVQRVYTKEHEFDDRNLEPQLYLRMLLNTERSTCHSFHKVRVGDVLIRVGNTDVSELGLEGSGTVLTKFFAKLMAQTPIKLTFQRMNPSDWEGGVEL